MEDQVKIRIRSVVINIRKIREYRQYSQEYMAMKLNISQNAYSKLELVYTRITVERLFEIAFILDIEPTEIFSRDIRDLIQIHSSNSSNLSCN